MTEQFYSIITNKGIELINLALKNNEKINLSYIAVGDGGGSYYEPQSSQTELKNEIYRFSIAELNGLTVKGIIPAEVGGFYIREVGLYDYDENLILIAKQPETYKPKEQEGSTKEMWIKIVIQAIANDVIELKIDKSIEYATVQWVLSLLEEFKKSQTMKVAQYDTNSNGFVDTCELVDGGDFLHPNEITSEVSEEVMNAIIYDRNLNGVIDTCEYVDGAGFEIEEKEQIQNVLMTTGVYDSNRNDIVDNAENIDAGEF